MSNKLDRYGLRNMYKGTFLNYIDKDYIKSNNLKAFIGVNDLILSKANTIESIEAINSDYIDNKNELNIQPSIKSINSIICKPLCINGFYPICKPNDNVMIFIFDNDIKKLYYAKINTEILENEEIMIKKGNNSIIINNDEIIIDGKLKFNGLYL